jgi:hypothetical protein
MSLAEHGLVAASDGVMTCDLKDTLALLDVRSNQYYSLNPVGALVWSTIQAPSSVDDICAAISEKFAVTAADCRADVELLLSKLEAAGLVRMESVARQVSDVESRISA